jgi:hypothetical protein
MALLHSYQQGPAGPQDHRLELEGLTDQLLDKAEFMSLRNPDRVYTLSHDDGRVFATVKDGDLLVRH